MTTPTTNYAWGKPVNGGDSDLWGTELNTLIDAIDSQVKTNANTATAADAVVTAASCQRASNLSDVSSASAARTNLGVTTNLIAVTYGISINPASGGAAGDFWFQYS